MTLQLAISYFFYTIASISIICFLMLSILYWKRERSEAVRLNKARNYLKKIAELFRVMREIMEQQEQMASEFSNEVDNKMQVVKDILGQGLQRNEELYERQRLLTQELDMAAVKLKEIQRKIKEVDEMIHADLASDGRKTRETRKNAASQSLPETPADAEKARKAFRTLLEIKRSEEENMGLSLEEEGLEAFDREDLCPPERKEGVAPSLRQQIEEYHALGMSVLEIADKLNISRGEVRLMLSLKEPQ